MIYLFKDLHLNRNILRVRPINFVHDHLFFIFQEKYY